MAEERGTVHSRLCDKRTKKQELFSNKAEGDRISALPDSLLLHIMSFLSTKEVVKTCLLSQRWQFLWTNISEIDLVEDFLDDSDTRFFVDCVGKLLLMCGGTYLKKFAVAFLYEECYASDVNTWLQFAVKNKVENIDLDFDTVGYLYMLPQILYSHSFLTSLSVTCCDMAPRGAIKWRSLKSLCIELMKLEECVMEKILSGCPVLEVLHLKQCWGLKCLKISSPSLATLVIEDWDEEINEENNSLAILAPYVLDLSIIGHARGYGSRLLNVSSVVRAKLCFNMSVFVNHADPSIPLDQLKKLLESLKSVKELELGRWCIEVLSVLEVKGWQFPPSTRSCLTLEACSDKRSIPGILGILKSSPNLETLVIKGKPLHYQKTEPEDAVAAYLHNTNLDLAAFHLKTVKITNFTKSSCSVEPMATLVQILLKGATVLEKMVISAKELDTNKLAVTLISFPRASPKAVIVFD